MLTRVLVCGSRNADISDKIVDACISDVLEDYEGTEIEFVSGGAKGGDKLGEDYAQANGYKVTQFKPDWSKYGRAAGPMRNTDMLNYIDKADYPVVIAFWDGASKGTYNTLKTAKRMQIPTHVIRLGDGKDIIEGGIQLTDDDKLKWDWNDDEPDDVLPLEGISVGQRTRNGHTFYYIFRANKKHPDWDRFLPTFKHSEITPDMQRLADVACRRLIAKFNNMDCVLYPKSSSPINQLLIDAFEEYSPWLPCYPIGKVSPKNITFDWDTFNKRYKGTEEDRQKLTKKLQYMMDKIHKGEKFSMQHQVHSWYRKYVHDFLEMNDLEDALDDILESQTILVLDDIYTTGSTMTEIINMLRSIGYEGDIVVFSLIDNK